VHDDELSLELARAYMKIGDIQGNPLVPNLSQGDRGLASYKKAEDIIRRLAADGESTGELEVRVRVGSGMLYRNQNEARAEKLLGEAVELANDLPPTPELQRMVVEASVGLAEQAFNRQDVEAAKQRATRSLEAAMAWSRMSSEAPLAKYFVGIARELVGQTALMQGDPETAVKEIEVARAIFRDLFARHPEDARYRRELGLVLNNLASYQAGIGAGDVWQPNLGDLEGARTSLREAIALHRRAVDSDPADTRARLDLAASYAVLGVALPPVEALQPLDESRRLFDKLTDQERQDPYAMNLGWVLDCAAAAPYAIAKRPDAAAVIERARKASAAANYPLADLQCEFQLIEARRALDGAPAASQAVTELLARLRTKLDQTPDAIVLRIGIVDSLVKQGELTGSCESVRQAIDVWAKHPGTATAYRRRHQATLEATAHACEEKRDRR
jgi:tetratricopeptide (TPR) repeat protein